MYYDLWLGVCDGMQLVKLFLDLLMTFKHCGHQICLSGWHLLTLKKNVFWVMQSEGVLGWQFGVMVGTSISGAIRR